MARPKKITDNVKSHLTNAEIEKRKAAEQKLHSTNQDIKPSAKLDPESKKEFKRIVSEMKNIEGLAPLVSNLDIATLEIYSNSFTLYRKLFQEVAKEGIVSEHTNKGGATNVVLNPKLNAMQKQIENIFKVSSKLGLSPVDRLKIVVPTKDDEDDEFSCF